MPDGVWTNNWHGVKNALLCGFVRSGWSTVYDQDGNLMTRYMGALPLSDYRNANSSINAEPALIFGTGLSTPAATDRALSSKWVNGISRVAVSNGGLSFDETTHTASRIIRATVQNTGSLPVTVTDWGIVGYAVRGTGQSADILLSRELLNSPVTLQQYASATLSVTVSVQLTDPA